MGLEAKKGLEAYLKNAGQLRLLLNRLTCSAG
jgi:hypothetical protein